MTREEKKKAIDALKISAPVMVVTQEKFNDYIQTLNKVMNWLEQEPCEDEYIKVPKTSRSTFYKYTTKNGKEIVTEVYQNEVLKGKVYFIGNSKFIKSSDV